MSSYAIETDQLTKHYGKVTAVENLALRVAEGEIYAFLGLNGAGKTTTIRMLLGMIKPTRGEVTVLGTPVRLGSREPWSQVGYLVEIPYAYSELTVEENLEVTRRLHPGTPSAAVGEVIERLGLGEYAERRAGTLSHGNAQRLGIAKALLHHPRLLLLDEPANGLDPAGIVEIRTLLRELSRDQGVTVFMSSHILAEVTRLADRIGIIHQGRLLRELEVDELERERHRRLVIEVENGPAGREALLRPTGLEALAAAGYPFEQQPDGSLQSLDPSALDHPEQIATILVRAGAPPRKLVVEQEDLESYFLRLVGKNGGEA